MISQEQFDKAKAASSGKDPLIKKVKLSDIRIDDNSLKTGNILYPDWGLKDPSLKQVF